MNIWKKTTQHQYSNSNNIFFLGHSVGKRFLPFFTLLLIEIQGKKYCYYLNLGVALYPEYLIRNKSWCCVIPSSKYIWQLQLSRQHLLLYPLKYLWQYDNTGCFLRMWMNVIFYIPRVSTGGYQYSNAHANSHDRMKMAQTRWIHIHPVLSIHSSSGPGYFSINSPGTIRRTRLDSPPIALGGWDQTNRRLLN